MFKPFRTILIGLAVTASLLNQTDNAEASTKVQQVISPGGIKAYLISEPAIPFMSLAMRFQGGAIGDPEGKEGLANLISGLLDEGAGELDSQAFRTELEDLAIRLSFDAGRDSFAGDLKTLTEHRDRAFELLRLALNEPRFDDEPLDRIRGQIIAGLKRRSQDPDYLGSRRWFEEAFEGHIYARPVRGTIESVEAITRDDLTAFVGKRLAKDNLLIGVAGDVTADELGPLLDHAFGGLPETSEPLSPEIVEPKAKDTFVVRQDVPQSKVLFGQKALARKDPDYYAAYVTNHILGGGGFTSRLTNEIREERGLAYSVYSYLYPMDFAPIWLGGLGTSNASVAEALDLVRGEVKRLRDGDVGQAELDDAKTYLTAPFPFG